MRAELRWSGAIRARVGDGNGSASGCGHKNLSIAEGRAVDRRVCIEGLGCSVWFRRTA